MQRRSRSARGQTPSARADRPAAARARPRRHRAAPFLPEHVVHLARVAGSRPDDSLALPAARTLLAARRSRRNPVVRYVVDALRFYFEFHARYDGFYGASSTIHSRSRRPSTARSCGRGRHRRRRDRAGLDHGDDRRRLARLWGSRRMSTSRSRPTRQIPATVLERVERLAAERPTWHASAEEPDRRDARPGRQGGGRIAESWIRALVGIVAFFAVMVVGSSRPAHRPTSDSGTGLIAGGIPDPDFGRRAAGRVHRLRRRRVRPDRTARVDQLASSTPGRSC